MIESLLLCRGDCRRSSSPLFMLYLLLLINWVLDFDRWKFDRLNVLFLFFSISEMSWSPQKSQETFRIQSSKDWPFVIIVYEALLQAILVQMCFVCFRSLFAFAVQRWLMRMWGHEKLNIAWPKSSEIRHIEGCSGRPGEPLPFLSRPHSSGRCGSDSLRGSRWTLQRWRWCD